MFSSFTSGPELQRGAVATAAHAGGTRNKQAKTLFKKLARQYLRKRSPPTESELELLSAFRNDFGWLDLIKWRDEVGVLRGIVYEDDGTVTFDEWTQPPHDQVIGEFSRMFLRQLVEPWENAPVDPTFETTGSQGMNYVFLHLKSNFDLVDIEMPGRKKQPDQSFTPQPRPNLQNPALAALVRIQPLLGRPWPTVIFESGNSQTVRNLAGIRDRVLGHMTSVNVFVGIAYNRNQTRASDSWWACVAVRNTAPGNPPANPPPEWPPCIIVGEIRRGANGRYQKLETPVGNNNTVWRVNTNLLYHPEPVPALHPAFPATFDIDIERLRRCLVRTRPA